MALIVVSNRLPVVVSRGPDGSARVEPGAGGLITALRPVLRDRAGAWVGWSGLAGNDEPDLEKALEQAGEEAGYRLHPVSLTRREMRDFYQGFSNEVIWPLFHDSPSSCDFQTRYWRAYEEVNRKFAEVTARHAGPGDFLWIHDYHLMGMGRHLREIDPRYRAAFFLHIPFPPLDLFLQLPWRFQVLRSLLDYELIGFQTLRDRRNFLESLNLLCKDVVVSGQGPVLTARRGPREVRIGAFPIGIDFNEFARRATDESVERKTMSLREDEPGRRILLGVDRLDYTKGIPNKLEAFGKLLETRPDLRGRVTLVQVAVPSREGVPGYREFRSRIERLVGEINGEFTRSGWVPVHYLHRSLDRPKLLAYYRSADVALVTPLKDGMNLVAKEYCAANVTEDGALVLSEFAGAAAQLRDGALLVNPYDVEGTAAAIGRAVALAPSERRVRMARLRRSVRESNIYWWLDSFLRAAFARDLSDFPQAEDYVPQLEEEHELSAH